MTVLDLDSPPPTLRLVSCAGSTPGRDLRYRHNAPLYGDARDLYQQVLQFALENRLSVDADALRVVLATKQTTTPISARAFTASGIWQLLFVDVVTWCRNHKLDMPTGCTTALLRALEFLELTNSFDQSSDSIDQLHEAIDECTGGWVDDPHPSTPSKARRSLRSDRGPKRT